MYYDTERQTVLRQCSVQFYEWIKDFIIINNIKNAGLPRTVCAVCETSGWSLLTSPDYYELLLLLTLLLNIIITIIIIIMIIIMISLA